MTKMKIYNIQGKNLASGEVETIFITSENLSDMEVKLQDDDVIYKVGEVLYLVKMDALAGLMYAMVLDGVDFEKFM